MSNQTMKSKERREYAPRRASVLPNLDLWPVTTGHQRFNISMREPQRKKTYMAPGFAHIFWTALTQDHLHVVIKRSIQPKIQDWESGQ